MRWPFSSESWWLQLSQILDQIAAHFFLKTDAFSGWTNRKRDLICAALHSCLPPNVKMHNLPPVHHPQWRPGSHDTKPPCILKFTVGNCVLCYQDHPFPFFWPSVLLFLPMFQYFHSYFTDTNTLIFLQNKMCTCNPDWTQLNQHMPWTQTFSGTLCSGAVTHHKDRGQFWLLFVFPHLQFW